MRNCVVFRENLHSWHKFYTTAGHDGCDKSQLCQFAAKFPSPTDVDINIKNFFETTLACRKGTQSQTRGQGGVNWTSRRSTFLQTRERCIFQFSRILCSKLKFLRQACEYQTQAELFNISSWSSIINFVGCRGGVFAVMESNRAGKSSVVTQRLNYPPNTWKRL